MNRTDRLVAMVLFLQGRRLVRAEDLAAHFSVSLRTVYRDIAALGEAGVPISGEAGVGYTLVKGYHLPPVLFTGEEAAALFVGGEMVKRFADASLHGPADSALLKIRSVLPRERQDELQRLERATFIGSSSRRPGIGLDRSVLRPIQQALVSCRVLELTYRGSGAARNTHRIVEPMGVVFAGGAWYLVAWCRLRDAVRHFRLDRIQTLRIGAERFTTRRDFSLQQHLDEMETSTPKTEVRIRFAPEVIERVRAESHTGLLSETPVADGIDVRLHAYSLDWCARWVLSFGAAAEACAPAELRVRVREQARDALARHGGRLLSRRKDPANLPKLS